MTSTRPSAADATNDGSDRPPRLRVDINAGNLFGLPATSSAPRGDQRALLAAAKAAGFAGVQGADPGLCRELGLGSTGAGRVDRPADADPLAAREADAGRECATLHVGSGHEDDDAVARLVEAILDASARRRIPLFIETHRATVTQDTWRTVQIAKRFPEVRFNGDFSHWYTGLEMVYGDFAAKLDFLAPVFARTRFIHGRIGDPGCIQRDIGIDGSALPAVAHFREIWTRAFAGFLRGARPGDYFCFAPELLGPQIWYARLVRDPRGGAAVEESDRWQQAILYGAIARECFAEAQRRIGAATSGG